MARLRPGRPVISEEPTLLVDNELPPGRYRFRLRVIDDDGNISGADERELVVRRSLRPVVTDRITIPRRTPIIR